MVLRQEDFTSQAQEAISDSQQIMRRYSHSQWDSEHLLLALLELKDGLPVQVFKLMGIEPPMVVQRLEKALEQGPRTGQPVTQIYATPRYCRRWRTRAPKRNGCRTSSSAPSICCWRWSPTHAVSRAPS